VVAAVVERLPNEQILYFGDTARCPYGDKTVDEVITYSIQVLDYLYHQGVKSLVIACNTATAVALPILEERYDVPVIGVIQPGARAAVQCSESGNIGVIGTAVTIRSNAYRNAVLELNSHAQVQSLACPALVPLVEAGKFTGSEVEAEVRRSLAPLQSSQIDALVLGCTHYPLLAGVISEVVGSRVRLISSAEETANELEQILFREGETRFATNGAVNHRFYTSGDGHKMTVALHDWFHFKSPEKQVYSVGW